MSETPVLVGIAQNEQRPVDPKASKEPLALMLEAVRAAAEDAGAPALLTEASSVRVVRGMWPYKNPARVIADAIGCPEAETRLSQFGGNFVQTTVNQSELVKLPFPTQRLQLMLTNAERSPIFQRFADPNLTEC